MSITAIDLCSRALLLIGANAIQSFEDGTRESNVCSSIYETVRDTLLTNRDWLFSIHQQELARLNIEPLHDWKYVYAFPKDVLRIRKVVGSKSFDILADGIYSNDPKLSVDCQKTVDAADMPAYFQSALISELCAKLSISLLGDENKFKLFSQLAQRDLVNARLVDSQNAPNKGFEEDSFWITIARQ